MNNKETVQQGLDARKEARAAREETEQFRKDLEEAGHEMVRLQLSHENDKNYWNREKSELMDLLFRECDKNRNLENALERMDKRARSAERRGQLVNLLKTAVFLVLVVLFRDLDMVDLRLAGVLTISSVVYLAVSVIRLARGLKN